MISLVVILSLLSFSAEAQPFLPDLLCHRCEAKSTTCQFFLTACPSDIYSCGSKYTVKITGCEVFPYVSRECIRQSQCGFTGSKSIKNDQYRTVILCCRNVYCDPDTSKFLEANERVDHPNGLICPTCSSDSSSSCNPSHTVKCKGAENMCFVWTKISIGGGSFSAAQGCSTQSHCDQGNKVFTNSHGSSVQETTTCTKASKSIKLPN